jgi:hypothetical protein
VFTSDVGFSAIEERVKSTNCFGLSKNCTIETSDGSQYSYNVTSNTLVSSGKFDISGSIKTLKTISSGKKPSLNLGRLSYFSQDHVNYCITDFIPFITVYHDSKTSASSRIFYENAVMNTNFKTNLKELKCPIFMIDRGGIGNSSSELTFYKSSLKQKISQKMGTCGYTKDQINEITLSDYFCCICFVYFQAGKILVKQISTILTPDADMFSLFKSGYNECSFNQFDYSDYDSADAPDDETIQDSNLNKTDLVSFIGITPWWINSNSASYTKNFEFATSLDFRYIASKENTYAFVAARDAKNTTKDGSLLCKELTDIFGKYAFTVESLCDKQTYSGMFCEKLKKGLKYKKFLFFEFSHGDTEKISIDPDASVTK